MSKTLELIILPYRSDIDFSENKVQGNWKMVRLKKKFKIKLHMIGKLQTNKVKFISNIWFILLDKLKTQKIADEQKKLIKN